MLVARYIFSALRYALILYARCVTNIKNSEEKKSKSGTPTITPSHLVKSEAKRVGETTYRRASVAARSNEEITNVPRLTSQVRGANRAIVLFCSPCSICERCMV